MCNGMTGGDCRRGERGGRRRRGPKLSERKTEGRSEGKGEKKGGLTTGNEGHVPGMMRAAAGEVTQNGNEREKTRADEKKGEKKRGGKEKIRRVMKEKRKGREKKYTEMME